MGPSDVCRMQDTGSRENGRGVGYVGAREIALHSSSKDRKTLIQVGWEALVKDVWEYCENLIWMWSWNKVKSGC